MSITSVVLAALPALVLKATLLLLAALAATALLRRAPAAARHLVWLAALVGVLALPVLEAVVPAWRVLPALPTLHLAPAPSATLPVDDRMSMRQNGLATPPEAATTVDGPAALAAEATPASSSSPTSAAPATTARTPLGAGALLVGVWLLGAALLLARLAYGLARVHWLERRAEEVTDEAWLHLADRLTRRLGLGRMVRLLRAPDATVPMTWGTLRPVVLLPAGAERWSDERRRVVLAHELAHVRRWDAATQWVPHLAVCLFWFHPLVWVAAHRLRAEREHACDDAVLEIGTRPTEYADHLLELVRSLGAAQGPVAALAMARRSQFEGRMLAILDSAARRGGVSRAAALAVAAVAALAVLPLAAVRAAEPTTAVAVQMSAREPAAGTADLSGMVAESRLLATESSRAEFLVRVVEKAALISREGVRWRGPSPYVQVARAAAEITSPSARRRVLVAVVECPEADRAGLLAALDATRGMPGGVDLREILAAFVDRGRLDDDTVRREWLAARERLPGGEVGADMLGEQARPDTLPRRGEVVIRGRTQLSGATDADGWTTRMVMSEATLSYDPERAGEGSIAMRGREITVQTNNRTARIRVADDGFATLEEMGDDHHRLEIRGNGTRRYTVDGRPRAWDAAARAWEARYLERLRDHLTRPSGSARRETTRSGTATRRWDGSDETEGGHHGEPSFSLRLNARGVELAARAPEVVAIRPGGTLSIDHTLHPAYPDADPLRPQGSRATLTRSLRGVPAADGSIRWRYTVNGAERPFDAEGRAWLARVLTGRKL